MIVSDALMEEYNKTRDAKDLSLVCHAPFVSINFEQSGKATACCYNRKHVLGTYPADSIREMWWGDKAVSIRQMIKDRNLGGGCEVCSKQLESKNFFGTHARHFDPYASEPAPEHPESVLHKVKKFFKPSANRLAHYPKALEFELSNACNLECVMCTGYFSSSIRKNREKRPAVPQVYDAAFVEQLEEFIPHLTDAKFLGGEPFQIDIYYSIWESIQRINPHVMIHITTNATVLSGRAKELLENLRCGIVISIDSIVKETYERIRVNARYDKVLENIEYFRKYTKAKRTWMSFAVCPMTINWREIPDMVKYCNKEDIYLFFNTVFKPEEYTLRFLPARILGNIIAYYKSINFLPVRDVHRHNVNCFLDLIKQLERWHFDAVNHEKLQLHTIQKWEQPGSYFKQFLPQVNNAGEEVILYLIMDFVTQKTRYISDAAFDNWDEQLVVKMQQFIASKEKLVKQMSEIRLQMGYGGFLPAYLNGIYYLHIMFNKGKRDTSFAGKCEKLCEVIFMHPRHETIIDEMITMEPLYTLSVIHEFTLDNIAFQINNSY